MSAAFPITCAVLGCWEQGSLTVFNEGGMISPPRGWGIVPADYAHPKDTAVVMCPRHIAEQPNFIADPDDIDRLVAKVH